MNFKNIDTTTTAGKIEVMRAYENGEKVVFSRRGADDHSHWRDLQHATNNPGWDWIKLDYRVVENPRVLWVNLYADRTAYSYFSEQEARSSWARRTGVGPERIAVKFVEVVN